MLTLVWEGETAFRITTAITARLLQRVGNEVTTKMPRYHDMSRSYSIPCKAVTTVPY